MQEDEDRTIGLAREFATVEVRRRLTGRVRVRTVTETEKVLATGELEGESVEVERVALDRYVDTPPSVRTEGDVTIVPVVEEVLVTEKRLVLIEEIHIRRVPRRETVEAPVTLRRQRAVIERIDPETGDVLPDCTPTSET